MRRAQKPPPALVDEPVSDDWIEGEDKMLQRQRAAAQRMAWHDRLPADLRRVANGLPVPHQDLLAAIEAGCTTQEEAEEWFRSIVGRTVLG